ncbi:MAG: transposase [Planctomycetota bacterium]
MLAFHAIISAYGFWLPNDPRGSWSTYVGSRALHQYGGNATKVSTRRSVALRSHCIKQRYSVKQQLKYTPVRFTGWQALSIASGFEQVACEADYRIVALAIMPTHIHAVILNHSRKPSQIMGHLKRGATNQLIKDSRHPCLLNGWVTHSCWAKQAWAVYIDTERHLRRAIQYVEENPINDGLRPQKWSVVNAYRDRVKL